MFRDSFAWMTRLTVAAAFMTATSFAAAAPITFTHSGIGSGSVGETSFTDAAFTITATGDTEDRTVIDGAAKGFSIVHSSAQIDIEGGGLFNFTTATSTFVWNESPDEGPPIVGFATDAVFAFITRFTGPSDPAFKTWDMQSSIGPIVGLAELSDWGLLDPPDTDGGLLAFESGESSDATFEATVAVPAPGSLALLGLGLMGLALVSRRSKQ